NGVPERQLPPAARGGSAARSAHPAPRRNTLPPRVPRLRAGLPRCAVGPKQLWTLRDDLFRGSDLYVRRVPVTGGTMKTASSRTGLFALVAVQLLALPAHATTHMLHPSGRPTVVRVNGVDQTFAIVGNNEATNFLAYKIGASEWIPIWNPAGVSQWY